MPELNIVAVTFPDDSTAYKARSVLHETAAREDLRVLNAIVVERDTHGGLRVRETDTGTEGTGPAGGALIGTLIGVLGGPLGMLLGASTGALLGGALEVERTTATNFALREFADALPPGSTALVAEVAEFTPTVLDEAMTPLGGTILRRSAEDVLAELEASQDALRAAQREADQQMRQQRKTERKDHYEERKDALLAKLTRR